MRTLDQYLTLLRTLKISSSSLECLERFGHLEGEEEVLADIYKDAGLDKDVLLRQAVLALDRSARSSFLANQEKVQAIEGNWLRARVVEFIAASHHLPLCKFCYRTVDVRMDHRPKEFCSVHASGGETGNPGGYLRGRKSFSGFLARLTDLRDGLKVDEIEVRLLRLQLASVKRGGGDAGWVVNKLMRESAEDFLIGEERGRINLHNISHSYPDWTELALRWRSEVGDVVGKTLIENGRVAISPRLLMGQWIRFYAWSHAGDRDARIGKGRPVRIEPEKANALKAAGQRNAEIAKIFGVSKGSVDVFFSRQKKRGGSEIHAKST